MGGVEPAVCEGDGLPRCTSLCQFDRTITPCHRRLNDTTQVALLKELNAYVKFHFISEENMMRFAGYDLLSEHQRHHYELIDQLNAKESGLNVRYNADEAHAVVDFLVHWFTAHTTGEDKQFAEFLHRQNDSA